MRFVGMTVSGEPDRGALEAALYDWHNEHRLRRQSHDVPYWLATTKRAARLLVLGAGTGRVAARLARKGRWVTAMDASAERLRRITVSPAVAAVCGDLRALPLTAGFDAAVLPYSTFQLLRSRADRQAALLEAARVLAVGGSLHIDVSGSFDTRTAADWHLALSAHWEPADATLEEWERCQPEADHVAIDKSFRLGDRPLLEVRERWTYLSALDLPAELERAGIEMTGVDHGYGHGSAPHRRIYHGSRLQRNSGGPR